MKVYLDDMRDCPSDWVLARNVPTLIHLVKNNEVTHLSLDHDLGEGEMTGYDFMRWLEAEVFHGRIKKLPDIVFHTANPVGRDKMRQVKYSIYRILESQKKETEQ